MAICMGLDTGLVALGGMAEPAQSPSAFVGHAASQAIALQACATPGTILCSETTAAWVRPWVRLEMARDGSTTSRPVYQIVGRPPRHRVLGRTHGIHVGRERELALLHALREQVEAGQGQVVGIVGEPGMGKSRLVETFRHSLRRRALSYVAGRCLSYTQTTPYWPIRDLLRHACGITGSEPPSTVVARVHRRLAEVGIDATAAAPYLLQLLGHDSVAADDPLVNLSPEAIQLRTFDILRQLALSRSQRQPLIIEIEDLHWMDATSQACLATLVDQLAGVPILILTTYRPGYRPPWIEKSYATQVSLAPLTPPESRRVVEHALAMQPVSDTLMQDMVAKAGGNPLFLEELARAVRERGLHHLPTLAPTLVPDTIQAILTARIDQLPPLAKRLLQAAAVIGSDISHSLLQAIAELSVDELQQGLMHLQAAELIHETRSLPDRAYAFQHILTQEVAYSALLTATRQHYHQHIAQVLATQFPEMVATQPERLAYHYTEAGLNEEAVTAWTRAGQHAVARSAYVEGMAHLTTGLEALSTLPETTVRCRQELTLLTTIGPALMAMKGQRNLEVGRTYSRAQELCRRVGEPQQLFPVLMGLWRFHAGHKVLSTMRDLAEQLLQLAQRLDDLACRVEAHLALGTSLYFEGEFVPARDHLEQCVQLYDPRHHRAHAVLYVRDPGVSGRIFLAFVLWELGYPDQAMARNLEAVTLARDIGHPASLAYALLHAGTQRGHRGEGKDAQELAETALAYIAEQGYAQWYWAQATILRGGALVMQGQREAGLALIQQGLAANRSDSGEGVQPHHLSYLAKAYACCGQPDAGLQVVAEAMAILPHNGYRLSEAHLYLLQGELLLLKGPQNSAEAEACFRKALALARQYQAKSRELQASICLSRLWQQQGKREEARHQLAGVYKGFTEGFDTMDLREAKALLDMW